MDANGNTSEFCQAKQVVEQIGGIGVLSSNETWPIGSTQTIRWVSSGNTDDVKIELLAVDTSSQRIPELDDMSIFEFLRLVCQPCGSPPPSAGGALKALDGSIDNPSVNNCQCSRHTGHGSRR